MKGDKNLEKEHKDVSKVMKADEIEALFIDVIGRPATPVSAAGMHRRTRRRTRRRGPGPR